LLFLTWVLKGLSIIWWLQVAVAVAALARQVVPVAVEPEG
jgi:hypothetical protein